MLNRVEQARLSKQIKHLDIALRVHEQLSHSCTTRYKQRQERLEKSKEVAKRESKRREHSDEVS